MSIRRVRTAPVLFGPEIVVCDTRHMLVSHILALSVGGAPFNSYRDYLIEFVTGCLGLSDEDGQPSVARQEVLVAFFSRAYDGLISDPESAIDTLTESLLALC